MVSPFPQHVRRALTEDGVNLETTSSRFAGLKYRLTPYIACFLFFLLRFFRLSAPAASFWFVRDLNIRTN